MMEFGQRVKVKERYIRKFKRIKTSPDAWARPNTWKSWERVMYLEDNCIFLGYRTLSNGRREYDSEYGYTYTPKEYFKAALVCPNERENPVYVPLNEMDPA